MQWTSAIKIFYALVNLVKVVLALSLVLLLFQLQLDCHLVAVLDL